MTETDPAATTSTSIVPAIDSPTSNDAEVDQSPKTVLPQEATNLAKEENHSTQKTVIENPEWGLKEIVWPPEKWEGQDQRAVRIITQNANGPCSFIAICMLLPSSIIIRRLTSPVGNILILRGAIRITPPDRRSASYEYLSSLVGDYLVNTALGVDIAAVFSILPKTQCE
jgi:hypothetical protein